MFNVMRHHPQIGMDDYGGGAPHRPQAIASTPRQEDPNFIVLEAAFPGFRDAYKRSSVVDQAHRIADAIRLLNLEAQKKEPQYIYIEKTAHHDGVYTSGGDQVVFIPDGTAQLVNLQNGETYKFKLPGYTITCVVHRNADLVLKTVMHDSGGENVQMYIPRDSAFAKMLRVRRTVNSEVPTKPKPAPRSGPSVLMV